MSKANKSQLTSKKHKPSINESTSSCTDNKKNKWIEAFKIIPLLLIVGLLPFVVRLKPISLEGPFYDFWKGERINPDFFTYYKQIFIYIITAWSILHTFLFTKKIKFTKAYYFMGAYVILVITSTIFSNYPQIALHGFNERREGMWIVLCYLLLIFSSINLIGSKNQLKFLIYTFGISGAIISFIAIFQYIGFDIFSTDWIKSIIIPNELIERVKDFNIGFGKGQAYSVFYNPNYLGGYLCLYVPIVFTYALSSESKNEKYLFSIFATLGTISLFFTKSEAGIVGLLVSLTILIGYVIIDKKISENNPQNFVKKLLIFSSISVMLLLVISYIPIQVNPIKEIRIQVADLILPSKLPKIEGRGPINDIKKISKNEIELMIDTKAINLRIEAGDFEILDETKKIIFRDELNKNGKFNLVPDKFGNFELKITPASNQKNTAGIELFYTQNEHHIKLYFLVIDNEIMLTNPKYQEIKSLIEAKSIGFEGKYTIGSNRGYIWSRSIPLALDNLIIGTGQDTFITVFPQNDIYGNQRAGRYHSDLMWQIVDKPHNMYLQIAIQSGILSLLIYLSGLALLFYKSFKNVFLEKDYFLLGITVAILGFMLSSIFNDSIIAIMPIVYIFLGICINLNIKNKGAV